MNIPTQVVLDAIQEYTTLPNISISVILAALIVYSFHRELLMRVFDTQSLKTLKEQDEIISRLRRERDKYYQDIKDMQEDFILLRQNLIQSHNSPEDILREIDKLHEEMDAVLISIQSDDSGVKELIESQQYYLNDFMKRIKSKRGGGFGLFPDSVKRFIRSITAWTK